MYTLEIGLKYWIGVKWDTSSVHTESCLRGFMAQVVGIIYGWTLASCFFVLVLSQVTVT